MFILRVIPVHRQFILVEPIEGTHVQRWRVCSRTLAGRASLRVYSQDRISEINTVSTTLLCSGRLGTPSLCFRSTAT